jgi:hypothetical protein
MNMPEILPTGLRSWRVVLSCALLLGGLTACESVQQRITEQEDKLSAAGFIVKPANTPDRQAMLKKLPADKFVRRENGDTFAMYTPTQLCAVACTWVSRRRTTSSRPTSLRNIS